MEKHFLQRLDFMALYATFGITEFRSIYQYKISNVFQKKFFIFAQKTNSSKYAFLFQLQIINIYIIFMILYQINICLNNQKLTIVKPIYAGLSNQYHTYVQRWALSAFFHFISLLFVISQFFQSFKKTDFVRSQNYFPSILFVFSLKIVFF